MHSWWTRAGPSTNWFELEPQKTTDSCCKQIPGKLSFQRHEGFGAKLAQGSRGQETVNHFTACLLKEMPLEFPYRASQPKLRGARFDQNNTLPVKSPRPKLTSDSEGSCIFKVSHNFPARSPAGRKNLKSLKRRGGREPGNRPLCRPPSLATFGPGFLCDF